MASDPDVGGTARAARRAILDQLVARRPAEGRPALTIRLAGLVVAIRSDDHLSIAGIRRGFASFAEPRRVVPDAEIELTLDRSAGIWVDGSPEPRAAIVPAGLAVEHRDFVGVLSADASRMVVAHPRYVLAVENALRVLTALLLLRRGGLLLHAAGVVRDPGATVLFGRSGSGKTTAARMARARPVLGDDMVALRRDGDGWLAHSAPFGGGRARPRLARSARLNELFRLHQADTLEVRDLPAARGVAELLQSAVLPAGLPEDRTLALDRCLQLQRDVGVQELCFPLHNGLWRWLDERGV